MIKSIVAGILGAVVLFLFYFLLLALLAGSWWHPMDDLLKFKYWIGALLAGFAIQVGLYYHIRSSARFRGQGGKEIAVGTGTSTMAMVACCAHHLAELSFLRDGKGKEHQGKWTSPEGGGHHRSGFLLFGGVEAGTEEIELIIRDVAGVRGRKFTWQDKNQE